MKHDLYLQVAEDGVVWSATEKQAAASSDMSARKFASSRLSAGRVYLLGSCRNSELILELHKSQQSGRLDAALFVGTPLICRGRQDRARPELVLHLMPGLILPSSLGGWHGLSQYDVQTYEMVSRVQKMRAAYKEWSKPQLMRWLRELVSQGLRHHPVWPAFSFLPGGSAPAAALLMAEIIDPRWYGNPKHPDRVTRLIEYLGVKTDNLSHMLGFAVKRRSLHNCERGVLVVRALFGDGPRPSPKLVQQDSRYFLWRMRDKGDGSAKSLRRACVFGVNFLRLAWLQAISLPGEEIFVPEYLFHYELEAKDYKAHVAGFQKEGTRRL